MTPAATSDRTHGKHRRWLWLAALCVALGLVTSVGVAWGFAWRVGPIVWTERFEGTSYEELSSNWDTDGYKMLDTGWKPLSDIAPTVAAGAYQGASEIDDLLPVWMVYPYQRRGVVVHRISSAGAPRDNDYSETFDRHTSDAFTQRAIRHHVPLLLCPERFALDFSVVLTGWPWPCLGYEQAQSAMVSEAARKANPKEWVGLSPESTLQRFYGAWKVGVCENGGAKHVLPFSPLWPGLLANTAFYGGAWAVLIFTPLVVRRWLRARRGGCESCGYSREGLQAEAPCPECGRVQAP